jgi:hypothetical protein
LLTTTRAFSGLARVLVYLSRKSLIDTELDLDFDKFIKFKLSISRLTPCVRAFDIPPFRSKTIREEQHDEDDQDHADDTDAAVTVAAEAATEAPKLEDDEYDDEYESERYGLSPLTAPNEYRASSHSDFEALD